MPSFARFSISASLLSVVFLGLTACEKEAQTTQEVSVQPVAVQLFDVTQASTEMTMTFPAKVQPYRQLDIAFEVGGKIKTLNLLEGKAFQKGDVLAALNQSNFKRRLALSELKVQDAKVELDRINAVDKKGYISKQNVTKAETAYDMAKVERDLSKQDLTYTKLIAPFNGVVSKRYVEENSFVGVGAKIASIQDISQVYLAFDVPEKTVARMNERDVLSAKVKINGREEVFQAVYAEHEATPNPVTQTYQVFFKMPYPENGTLPMGVYANVELTLSASKTQQTPMLIPLSALASNEKGEFYVWQFEADAVQKVRLQTGKVIGNEIEVLSGLNGGERIVSAGVSKMRQGLLVNEFRGGL